GTAGQRKGRKNNPLQSAQACDLDADGNNTEHGLASFVRTSTKQEAKAAPSRRLYFRSKDALATHATNVALVSASHWWLYDLNAGFSAYYSLSMENRYAQPDRSVCFGSCYYRFYFVHRHNKSSKIKLEAPHAGLVFIRPYNQF